MKIFNWNIKPVTLFNFHSWMGLLTGIVMILVGFSGAIVVFNDEIEWLVTPEFRADPANGKVSIDEVVGAIQEAYPGVSFSLDFPPGNPWSYSAFLRTEVGSFNLLVSPESGRITKTRRRDGYSWSLSFWLRQFHVRLLMGRWGRVFVGIFGVTIFISCITGIFIYKNWIKSMFQLRRKKRRRVFHMDLHKLIGFWSLLFNLIIAFTGAILGIENLYNSIQQQWIRPAQTSPNTENEIQISTNDLHSEMLPASKILLLVKKRFPTFTPKRINFPVETMRPVVILGNHPGALIASNASRVLLDPYSGIVLSSFDARQAKTSSIIYNMLDPLHFGYFGKEFGAVLEYSIKALWVILGLTPGVLAITGTVMWWLRRKRRKPGGSVIKSHVTIADQHTAHNLEISKAFSYQVRQGWKIFSIGLLPFLAAGYVLQAMIWRDGWGMTELLFQHWIVKPVSLMVVCFPVSIYLYKLSKRCINAFAGGRRKIWFVSYGSIFLGTWYLLTLCLLN